MNLIMKTNSLLVVINVICLTILSCSGSRSINPEQVDHIVFFAWPKNVETPNAINTFELLTVDNWAKDTIISDRIIINVFVEQINSLKPCKPKVSDYRSAAVIKMKDGGNHICCFGEKFGISIDNRSFKDDDSVFRFIDRQIYETQPGDYWYSETIKEMMRSYKENVLSDSSR